MIYAYLHFNDLITHVLPVHHLRGCQTDCTCSADIHEKYSLKTYFITRDCFMDILLSHLKIVVHYINYQVWETIIVIFDKLIN